MIPTVRKNKLLESNTAHVIKWNTFCELVCGHLGCEHPRHSQRCVPGSDCHYLSIHIFVVQVLLECLCVLFPGSVAYECSRLLFFSCSLLCFNGSSLFLLFLLQFIMPLDGLSFGLQSRSLKCHQVFCSFVDVT